MFIDSHAHLTCDPVFENIDPILQRAQEQRVETIINICTDELTLKRGLDLAKRYPWIYNVGATTPHDVEKEGQQFFPMFEHAARSGQLVAIGETGLDYYYQHAPKQIQQQFLERYFELAIECQLPVVLHCREAFEDLFRIAHTAYPNGKAVLHCFTGTPAEAEKVIEKGWSISFSGIITFKKSIELREIVKEVPLSSIFIETDTPYLAPKSKRGKQNEPAYIIETAQMIADVKCIALEDVAHTTGQNIKRFFEID